MTLNDVLLSLLKPMSTTGEAHLVSWDTYSSGQTVFSRACWKQVSSPPQSPPCRSSAGGVKTIVSWRCISYLVETKSQPAPYQHPRWHGQGQEWQALAFAEQVTPHPGAQ